jgi:hypothetical protein
MAREVDVQAVLKAKLDDWDTSSENLLCHLEAFVVLQDRPERFVQDLDGSIAADIFFLALW